MGEKWNWYRILVGVVVPEGKRPLRHLSRYVYD